jgi:hypothetical protein
MIQVQSKYIKLLSGYGYKVCLKHKRILCLARGAILKISHNRQANITKVGKKKKTLKSETLLVLSILDKALSIYNINIFSFWNM